MVSDIDQTGRLLPQLGQNATSAKRDTLPSLGRAWVSTGGVAANGFRYAAPDQAVAYGKIGCPLLPRQVRQRQRGVKLPSELQKAFGESTTLDQLDSGAFERLTTGTLRLPSMHTIRDLLYSLHIPATQEAIPAGIPLAWFEELPISGRAHGAVRRAFGEVEEYEFLQEPMMARQFLNIRSVGVTVLNELSCVVESAELERTYEDPDFEVEYTALHEEIEVQYFPSLEAAVQLYEGMSTFNRHLYEFARWAIAETDAQTFGEALAELIRAGTTNDVWKPVAKVSLAELAENPKHPYKVLDEWVEQFDERTRATYIARISSRPHKFLTLEDLGAEFGVTRERIRQIEAKVLRILETFLTSEEAHPIRWRASTLRRTLGVAAPIHTVEHLLTSPPGCNDHRGVLLDMAGPYDREGEWFTLRAARDIDPSLLILTYADEVGRIDRDIATSKLTDWGLDVALHDRWLTRDGSVRLFKGQIVLWGTSVSDRLAFALADIGRPATVDEMIAHVDEDRSRNSINNALAGDPKLVKVSRSHWALASWNLAEYSGIAESMRELIEESGGSIAINRIVDQMHKTFGISEKATLTYCGAPMFVVVGETIRLRTQQDGPFRFNRDLIGRTPGVFYLSPMRLGRLLKLDKNILRGSGTALTHAAGSILEVDVNARLSFSNQLGDKVEITFPETSIMGPSIGSLRRIVERLSAREGDYLALVLDRTDMTVSACVTDVKGQSPSWELIGRLTGIDARVGLDDLARALSCDPGEVRSVLKRRGDADVLDFLPKSEASAGLDDALAALGDHIEDARGTLP